MGDGVATFFLAVSEQEFTQNVYTEAYVTLQNDIQEIYSEEYTSLIKQKRSEIEEALGARKGERLEEAKAEGLQEIKDGWAKLDDAQRQLDDAKQQLDDALAKLTSGEEQYNQSLAEYNRQISQAENQLAAAKAELDAGETQYQQGMAEYLSLIHILTCLCLCRHPGPGRR